MVEAARGVGTGRDMAEEEALATGRRKKGRVGGDEGGMRRGKEGMLRRMWKTKRIVDMDMSSGAQGTRIGDLSAFCTNYSLTRASTLCKCVCVCVSVPLTKTIGTFEGTCYEVVTR